MTETRPVRHIRASRADVYRALVDPTAIATVLHEGIPPGISAQDNEIGTRMALDKLAGLVESRATRAPTGYPLRSKPKEDHA